jgi:ABC-type dipeptide/oligopeptide/nickel transport system ATPase subunit
MTDGGILLRARGLTRVFRGDTALDGVDLEVREGSALGMIGESGSGKSTLVRLLLALDTPTAGTVEFDGRPVLARGSARSLRWLRHDTGIVFQDPYASLDPRMRVERIVSEPLWALGIEGDRGARVREVLGQVGLDPDVATRYPHEFSGGQRQRIALARALVHRPRLLVGDEPLSALDVTVRAQILGVGCAATRARRSSWSRTTSASCRTSATTSSSCTTAAWRSTVPWPTCCGIRGIPTRAASWPRSRRSTPPDPSTVGTRGSHVHRPPRRDRADGSHVDMLEARAHNQGVSLMNEPQIWTVIGVFTAIMLGGMTLMTTLITRATTAAIDGLRGEMRAEFGGVAKELTGLRAEMNARFDAVHARIDHLDRDVAALMNHVFGRTPNE